MVLLSFDIYENIKEHIEPALKLKDGDYLDQDSLALSNLIGYNLI